MRNKIILIAIILLGAYLRLYSLGQVPIGINWDEASLGYNAYSILHTGRDEFGAKLPIVIKSFGDYKPALYLYLILPLLYFSDLSNQIVRIPSAIAGIIAIAAMYYLVRELFSDGLAVGKKKLNPEIIGLVSAFFLALSPWHIQFSRVAFESNIGLTLNMLGLLFFLKGLKKNYLLILSAIFFCLAPYAYQSDKLFTPLIILAIAIIYRKEILAIKIKSLIIAVTAGIIVISPLVYYHIVDPNAFSRAQGVSVFSSDSFQIEDTARRFAVDRQENDYAGILFNNRRVEYAKLVAAGYLSHYDLKWLFLTGDENPRHHAPFMGLLYLFELPLIFIGIYKLVFSKGNSKSKKLIFLWLFLAAVPAALTNDVPHSVRDLNVLPMFQIFSALGLITGYYYLKESKRISLKLIGILFVCFMMFNYLYFVNQYFYQTNYYTSFDWRYGYSDLVKYSQENKDSYDKVVVSNSKGLDQSYIFFLFNTKYDPKIYQNIQDNNGLGDKNFDKYIFTDLSRYNIENGQKVLMVGEPGDFDSSVVPLKVIKNMNGSDYIWIVEKNNE